MEEPKLVRRNIFTDKVMMKQKKYLLIAIVFVVTLLISSSYALLTNFDHTEEVITFQTGNLNMTLNNVLIDLSGNLPEDDTNGLANATPITLTLTNTGTMFIDGYDVKLVSDENKTSTLNEDYIKYAISEDGISYSKASILTSNNNIIFSGYDLDIDQSKTIYLKVWIDENAGNSALNKEYYGSIQVDLYQKKGIPLVDAFEEVLMTRTSNYLKYDDGIYVSGVKDDGDLTTTTDVDFNYVWYSGKLWRITAINKDRSLKMITENNITSIAYGSDSNYYTDEDTYSWIYQWLNQEFLPTLYNYENIIDMNHKWNMTVDDANVITKIPKTNLISAPVGIFTTDDYTNSWYVNPALEYKSTYLNIDYNWWVMSKYSETTNYIYAYRADVADEYQYATPWLPNGGGVRPVINLKSSVIVNGGSGTSKDPYMIVGDISNNIANQTPLNTRISGEYVKFDDELYRIVGTEVSGDNVITKLNKLDYLFDDSGNLVNAMFSNGITWGIQTNGNYWDYLLNVTWYETMISEKYKNMMVEGTFYLGTSKYDIGVSSDSYKFAICDPSDVSDTKSTYDCTKTSATWTGYVGLPRYGEMFATQQRGGYTTSASMWLITPSHDNVVLGIDLYGMLTNGYNTNTGPVRPSIYLSSDVKIIGGIGTPQNPFEISL